LALEPVGLVIKWVAKVVWSFEYKDSSD